MNQPLKTLAILSVLLNLLLLGIIVGHASRDVFATVHPTPQQIVAALPADQRAVFDATLAKAQAEIAPLRAKIDAARRDAFCTLASEHFDRRAYAAKMATLHRLHVTLTDHIVAVVADVAPQLSPAARVAFVDLLRPTPPRVNESPCASGR